MSSKPKTRIQNNRQLLGMYLKNADVKIREKRWKYPIEVSVRITVKPIFWGQFRNMMGWNTARGWICERFFNQGSYISKTINDNKNTVYLYYTVKRQVNYEQIKPLVRNLKYSVEKPTAQRTLF